MTEQEHAEWQERLRAAVADTIRRRAARRQQHQDFAAARAYGLQQRHARKLNPKDHR